MVFVALFGIMGDKVISMAYIRPTYGQHTANIRPIYGQYTSNIRPTYA